MNVIRGLNPPLVSIKYRNCNFFSVLHGRIDIVVKDDGSFKSDFWRKRLGEMFELYVPAT